MNPSVIINNKTYRKIMHWVNKSEYEVSGLGTIVQEATGVLRVTDAMLLPQKNGSTHTDIEPEDVARLMFNMRHTPGDLRFWWHSHVNMNVFWSGTDMDTIRKIGQGGWFLSTVFNKRYEMRSSFFSIDGQRMPWGASSLFLDELTTTVEKVPDPEIEEWDRSYTENVTNVIVTPRSFPYNEGWEDADTIGHQTIAAGVSPSINPLGSRRPIGMSKRDWKKFKRERKHTPALATLPSIIAKPEEIDAYGFTQAERTFLGEAGWTLNQVDDLFEQDFTPHEILQLAYYDADTDEVIDMTEKGWTPGDILKHLVDNDIPVADRGQNSHVPQ